MAVYVLTVAGSAKSFQVDTFRISETANGRGTLTCRFYSSDGSYRPALGAEVILTEDGTRIFGGHIDAPSETGLAGYGTTEILTTVTAVDFSALADRRYVNIDIAAGTLRAAGEALRTAYLNDYSVSATVYVNGSAVTTGPDLPALPYGGQYRKLTDVLNEISTLSGYIWEINYDKELRWVLPSSTAAPYNVVPASDTNAIGDITVEPTRGDYANRVIVRFSSAATHAYGFLVATANFGNGETVVIGSQTYTFQTVLTDVAGNVKIGGTVDASLNNLGAAIRKDTGGGTTYAASTVENPSATGFRSRSGWLKAIARAAGTVGNSVAVSEACANASWITEGGGVITALALGADEALTNVVEGNDAAEQASVGLWETVIDAPKVFDFTIAQALADAAVVGTVQSPKRVTYVTEQTGAHPGQTQTITVPERNLSGTFIITDVEVYVSGGNVLRRKVTAMGSTVLTNRWQDDARRLFGGGGATTVGAVTIGGGSSGGVSGSGTAGTLPKWLNAAELTDSIVTESGTTISIAGALSLTGGITAGSGVVGIVDSTGKIPAISSTYFASLSGANLTGIPETAITDGSILARVAGSEVITGTWTISGTEAILNWYESDAAVDAKYWRWNATATTFLLQSVNDAYTVATTLATFSRTGGLQLTQGLTAGSGAVGIIDNTGKIPAISSTYFASLSAANLTSIPAGQLTGTITSATQDLITRLGTITSGVWNAGAVTSSGGISGTTGTFSGSVTVDSDASGDGKLQLINADSALYRNGSSLWAESALSGGIALVATHASGDVTIYSRNALAATFGASQVLTLTGALSGTTGTFTANVAAFAVTITNAHASGSGVVIDANNDALHVRSAAGANLFKVNQTATAVYGTLGVTGVATFTNDVDPAINYTSNLGALGMKYLTLHAAELWVETLVAQNTMATIGGRILVAPTNILSADLAAAGTTLTVKYNNLASGDRVYLEADGKVEWMSVDSAPGGVAGAYTYTITRNLDASGANDWYAGDAVLNTGTTGDGFIDLYSLSGVLSGTGPTIVGNVRTGTTYNNIAARWAVGNLNGLYGYVADIYGFAAGDASNAWVKVDATNGVRIGHNATTKISLDAAGNASFAGAITAASGTIGSFTIGTYLYTGSKTAYNDANAGVHLGGDGIGIGNNVFTVSAAGALVATSATITGAITATSGAIGGWAIGADYLRDAAGVVGMSSAVTGGDDIRFWAGHATMGSAPFRVTEAGALTATNATLSGSLSAGGGNVTIDDNGVAIQATSAYFDPNAVRFVRAGYGGGSGDKYALYPIGTAGIEQINLENTAVATTATNNIGANIILRSTGWNGTAQAAANESSVQVWSGSSVSSTNNSHVQITATNARVIGMLFASDGIGIDATEKLYFDASSLTIGDTYLYESSANVLDAVVGGANFLRLTGSTARLGTDTTAYTQGNKVLIGNNSTEVLGLAGTSTLGNVNFYVNAAAARIATIQAARQGTAGGALVFLTKPDSAGDVAEAMRIYATTGITVGSPTGGDKGAGTLNATALYDDGTIVADWVFDLHYDGRSADPHAGCLYSLADTMAMTAAERRLPWMPSASDFEANRGLGALVTGLWQGQEQQQVYLFDHEARIARLERERQG